MQIKYLKSAELKNMAILLFFCFIISCISVYAATSCISDKIYKELMRQNMAVIGAVLNKYPEAEITVVSTFTRGISIEDLNRGRAITQKYGFDEQAPRTVLPSVFSYINKLAFINILVICLVTIAFGFIYFRFFRRIYDFAESASESTDKIMNGIFDVDFNTNSEGAISRLAFQLKLMAGRVMSLVESLNGEKNNLKEYLSDISHQLKTPLTSLRIYLDLLAENFEDAAKENCNEVNTNNIDYISKSNMLIDRMEWLIHGLLSMSRIEYSVVEMNIELQDLKTTLDTVLQELWFKLKARDIRVVVSPEDRPVHVMHDTNWMGQALENIIRNCADFSSEGGIIKVILEETEVLVRVKIRDYGPGIPEDGIPHVFERFYRGKSAKRNGNGIGLSLARLIIEKHHGFISVENAEGGGALFTISIPRLE